MIEAAGDERSRLLRALGLSRRFHLYLARCESPRAADSLVELFVRELPKLRKAKVELVRLDPYARRTVDAPMAYEDLTNGVLLPLLSPPEELRAHGVIHLVDASRASSEDIEPWARVFALWNERRNVLQSLAGEVVVLLPTMLSGAFATAAPDVWSIRSGEYAIADQAGATIESEEREVERGTIPWRAIPPLALFGGDFVVRPWLEELLNEPELSSETRSLEGDGGDLVWQRKRRRAEGALSARKFAEAESLFSELVRGANEDDRFQRVSALTGLSVALVGLDRAGEAVDRSEEAISFLEQSPALPSTVPSWIGAHKANALARWCIGLLLPDEPAELLAGMSDQYESSLALRLLERGRLPELKLRLSAVRREPLRKVPRKRVGEREQLVRILGADLDFLLGDSTAAAIHLQHATYRPVVTSAHESTLTRRVDALRILVEVARGNVERAEAIRTRPRGALEVDVARDPEGPSRVEACEAYCDAILAMLRGDRSQLHQSLMRARAAIEAWSRVGLDRRSLSRARLTVELALADAQPIDHARTLTRDAEALLGPTGEDCIARVLAVEAWRCLEKRLRSAADPSAADAAARALELAQPLGGLGVPAWEEIARGHTTARGITVVIE